MNIELAKTAMTPLCRKINSGRVVMSTIAIKNGYAYASDGHIAVRCRVEMPDGQPCDSTYDDCPKEYPIEPLGMLLDGTTVKKWMVLPTESQDWYSLVEELEKEIEKKKAKAVEERESRYKPEECPCCGETIYYDKSEYKLVNEEDVPNPEDIDYRATLIPVEVVIDDESVVVDFGYLWAVYTVLGKFEVGKDGFGRLAIRQVNARGCIVALERLRLLSSGSMPFVLQCEQALDKQEAEGGAK